MHIFIDESGSFIRPGKGGRRASCIAALIVPSAEVNNLGEAFARLRRQFAGASGGELKGSQLTERQVAQVISLLRASDVVLETCVIDMGGQDLSEITQFKEHQAQLLFEHVTEDANPGFIADLKNLQTQIRLLPDQLFLQAFMMISLLRRVLQTATLYYVQRRPEELAAFHWRIDAKDTRLTPVEQVWTSLIAPAVQEASRKEPLVLLEGADYTYFQRFDTPIEGAPTQLGVDAKAVLTEDRMFCDSRSDFGVQLADILAASLTRALNGTLQETGWSDLGRLIVLQPGRSVWLVELDRRARSGSALPDSHRFVSVLRKVEAKAKPMLVPSN
ncbi:MAG TPA: DUF3800 domain-containing protein [Gemmatimonadaceae bacterium]|nr:DUF3800 domain-containing protein [Gemmatimonadaceae bacterium]